MKSAKKKNPMLLQKLQSHRLLLGLVVLSALTLVLVGLLAYRNNQETRAAERAFQSDKIRFSQIEKDVEAVKANLDPKLQPGDKTEISKSCAYTAAKFERGTLSCSVNLKVVYADPITDKINEVKEAALQTGRFYSKDSSDFRVKDVVTGKERSTIDLYRSVTKGEFCALRQLDYGLASYTITCDRVVKKPVYEVIE